MYSGGINNNYWVCIAFATSRKQKEETFYVFAPSLSFMSKTTLTIRQEFPETRLPLTTFTTIRGVVEIITPPTDEQRPPFELCLVLDVSGSMSGSKLTVLKTAVESLLNLLIPDDVITIITYASEPSTVVARSSTRCADEIVAKVRRVSAGGGTNISAALEMAANTLAEGSGALRRGAEGCPQRRIFLYTDGQPGEGLRTCSELSAQCKEIYDERGMAISTFGIGTDVDGELLESMAHSGGGCYEFVTTRRMEEVSVKAVSGIARVCATRAEVEVKVLHDGTRILFPEETDEASVVATVGDVRHGNLQRIPVALDLSRAAQVKILGAAQEMAKARHGPQQDEPQEQQDQSTASNAVVHVPVAEVVFSCQPIDTPLQMFRLSANLCVGVRTERGGSEASTAPPPPILVPDPVVVVAFTLLEMSEVNERSIQLINQGTADSVQGAIQILTEGIEAMRRVVTLDTQGFIETAIRRADRTLQRLEARGAADSARVALELQAQSIAFDRQSGMGFQTSEASNHSLVLRRSPPRSPRGGSPVGVTQPMFPVDPMPYVVGSGAGSVSERSASDPDDDGMFPATPRRISSVVALLREGSLVAPRRPPSPPGQEAFASPLRKVEVPDALVAAAAANDRRVPPEFFCPITQQIMDDPVMTSDGHSYQRNAILQWFADGNIRSPLTGLGLPDLELRPNMVLRSMISNWR